MYKKLHDLYERLSNVKWGVEKVNILPSDGVSAVRVNYKQGSKFQKKFLAIWCNTMLFNCGVTGRQLLLVMSPQW